jgi:hypothetical protein
MQTPTGKDVRAISNPNPHITEKGNLGIQGKQAKHINKPTTKGTQNQSIYTALFCPQINLCI